MIVYLEPGLFLGSAVGSAKIRKQIKPLGIPKESAHIDDPFSWDDHGYFTKLILDVRNPIGVFLF